MERLFKIKADGSTISKEVLAGLTTFFTMAYIIAVNPAILSQAGMEWGAVFLATIIASVVGTLVMGLFANVPYALAPGMGLNAFFVYTVCFGLGFSWQHALSIVFLCGIINIIITVTRVRKSSSKPSRGAFSSRSAVVSAYSLRMSGWLMLGFSFWRRAYPPCPY